MPDMIVTAKGITSGYMPLAATLVSDRIFDAIAHRPDGALLTHGFTYSGHAVACAVAIANIDVMEREDLCGRVRSTGPYFEERLKTLGDLPIVGRRARQPLHALRGVGPGPDVEGALRADDARDREAHCAAMRSRGASSCGPSAT